MKKVMLILMLAVCLCLTGCTETQKYGNGDLPPDYVTMFGDDNGARLNFIQEQEINKLRANVYGFSHTDNDGKVTTGAGLTERVKELEADVLSLMKKPVEVVE